jgi:hypothetical protein
MNLLHLATDDGDVIICEDDLSSITDADLRKFRISRDELHRVFAEGLQTDAPQDVGGSCPPVCIGDLGGHWEVRLVRHSSATDPVQRGRPAGKA